MSAWLHYKFEGLGFGEMPVCVDDYAMEAPSSKEAHPCFETSPPCSKTLANPDTRSVGTPVLQLRVSPSVGKLAGVAH